MQNLPIQKRNKRKNLKRKGALDDFKLEPIDDVDAAPDVKIEVFEIEGSDNAVKDRDTHEEMVIEEVGTADVKIEVLEINTAEVEIEENEVEQTAKVEKTSFRAKSGTTERTAYEEKTEFYIPARMKSDVFDDAEIDDAPELPGQFDETERETRTHPETSSPQLIELNGQSENDLR